MPNLYDTVVVRQALENTSIGVGAIGTIVLEFDKPDEAYEVEFCDNNGRTIDQLALRPDQFDVLIPNPT